MLTGKTMSRGMRWFYAVLAALFVGFYLAMGFAARFGTSQDYLWLVLAAAAVLCRFSAALKLPRLVRVGWRALCILGICALLPSFASVVSGMNATLPEGLDYVIVLGARVDAGEVPSLALKRRIRLAHSYLEQNPDAIAIASGGQGDDEPIPEADCIYNELTKLSIASERILKEDRSTSTRENFSFSRALIPEGARVGFITNCFHVRRSMSIAQDVGFADISAGATGFTGFLLVHYTVRETLILFLQSIKSLL